MWCKSLNRYFCRILKVVAPWWRGYQNRNHPLIGAMSDGVRASRGMGSSRLPPSFVGYRVKVVANIIPKCHRLNKLCIECEMRLAEAIRAYPLWDSPSFGSQSVAVGRHIRWGGVARIVGSANESITDESRGVSQRIVAKVSQLFWCLFSPVRQ